MMIAVITDAQGRRSYRIRGNSEHLGTRVARDLPDADEDESEHEHQRWVARMEPETSRLVLVTLAPRQMMGIEMRVTVPGCFEEQSLVQWNEIPLTFSVFGIERHEMVPSNVQINLVGTESSRSDT